jgi:flagellar basal-body rod protein FlgB
MLPDLFSSTTIPALGEVLNFAQARHTVLTGNIANVNTPGYRLRDL